MVPRGNKIILKTFTPEPPSLVTYAKTFHFRRGSVLKQNILKFFTMILFHFMT